MIALLDSTSSRAARALTTAIGAVLVTFVLLCLQLLLLQATTSWALGTLDVCQGCTYETIQEAIDAADPGDRIRVAQGVYTENLVITKSLVLEGGYEASGWTRDIELYETMVDGDRSGSAICVTDAATVTIDGFTITGGQAERGGGIYVVDSTALITGNKVFSNTGQDFGGGIYAMGSGVTIQQNEIVGNNSGIVPTYSLECGYGGGIAILGDSVFTAAGNYVGDNRMLRGGGGVYISSSHGNLINNEIVGNGTSQYSSEGYGGGIYVRDCSPLIEGNYLISNSVDTEEFLTGSCACGGGVYLVGSSSIVTGNQIRANKVVVGGMSYPQAAQGGGIHASQSPEGLSSCPCYSECQAGAGMQPVIAGNLIEGNSVESTDASAIGYGGGISVWGAPMTVAVLGNQIVGNSTGWDSGGLVVYGCPDLVESGVALISGNLVVSNFLTSDPGFGGSGGLSVLTFSSTIKSNVIADNDGRLTGGLLVEGPWALVEGNDIVGNHGSLGGVIAESFGEITLVDNRIVENVGHSSVGAIGMSYGSFALRRNEIMSNTGKFGGAIAAGGEPSPTSITMDANEIVGNHATETGGGIHIWPDTIFTFTNNVIGDNSAEELGGGIYVSDSQGSLVNNTIAENEEGAGEGIYLAGSTEATMINNIVVSHTYGIYNEGSGTTTVTYNDVWGNSVGDYWGVTPGTGNISADPRFVDPGGWDYHLMPGSPAINAGHPDDSIAPPFDFEGDARPLRGRVDMGADEVAPEFSIVKDAEPGVAFPRATVSYTIVVSNLTQSAVEGVVLTDRVPADTTFGWAYGGGELVGEEVVWTGLSIGAGEALDISWGVTVTEWPVVEEIINDNYGVRRAEEAEAVLGEAVDTPVAGHRWCYPLAMKDYARR
ncbi:MAG: hypothetical protein GTO63_18040 [Anaerolineae bacterium]|nr:hypothetical protein [Anaerolineae bacterium]NIN98695.1 hypothetical protein [Anaerolineae bacterium]NIQ81585.1 hypothetical protein [Anaerolineae bacterium]